MKERNDHANSDKTIVGLILRKHVFVTGFSVLQRNQDSLIWVVLQRHTAIYRPDIYP